MSKLKMVSIFNIRNEFIENEISHHRKVMNNHLLKIEFAKRIIRELQKTDYPNRDFLIKQKLSKITYHSERIDYYTKQLQYLTFIRKLRKQVFNKFIRILNINIGKEILKGGRFRFNYNIGTLSILIGRNRRYSHINWGESLKLLRNIIKEVEPQLLEDYETGKILRFQYMQNCAKYTYPTAGKPRWIVYIINDVNWWFYFRKGFTKIENHYCYFFKPTAFIKSTNYDSMKDKEYPTIDSVIHEKYIGLVNKLTLLKTKFKSQNLYYDDISIS